MFARPCGNGAGMGTACSKRCGNGLGTGTRILRGDNRVKHLSPCRPLILYFGRPVIITFTRRCIVFRQVPRLFIYFARRLCLAVRQLFTHAFEQPEMMRVVVIGKLGG